MAKYGLGLSVLQSELKHEKTNDYVGARILRDWIKRWDKLT